MAFDLQNEILVDIKNKTVDQTDLTLAHFEVEASTRFTIQRDESVRLELTFSKDEMATIERAREILSHKAGGALNTAILEMAKVVIKAAQPNKARLTSKVPPRTNVSTYGEPIPSPFPIEAKDKPTAPPPKNYPLSSLHPEPTATVEPKSITTRIRRTVLDTHKGCEYSDPITGRICGSRYFLEVDHIRPRYLGGGNQLENLRALCKNHNIYRYQASIRSQQIENT